MYQLLGKLYKCVKPECPQDVSGVNVKLPANLSKFGHNNNNILIFIIVLLEK